MSVEAVSGGITALLQMTEKGTRYCPSPLLSFPVLNWPHSHWINNPYDGCSGPVDRGLGVSPDNNLLIAGQPTLFPPPPLPDLAVNFISTPPFSLFPTLPLPPPGPPAHRRHVRYHKPTTAIAGDAIQLFKILLLVGLWGMNKSTRDANKRLGTEDSLNFRVRPRVGHTTHLLLTF